MNGEQLLGFQRQALINAGADPDLTRPLSLLDNGTIDWMDHVTRIGNMQEYEINAASGNDRSKFYTS